MTEPDCSLDDIHDLVHAFYAQVRADPMLGPIFDAQIDDWDAHLATMVRFWSQLLQGTDSYQGSPMQRHVALPHLDAAMFQQWLTLFHQTTASHPNRSMAQRADTFAERVARSLWYGYQLHRNPNSPPSEIHHG